MIHVLVMANNSLLADAIASILSRLDGMNVLRLTHPQPGNFQQVIHEHHPEVIVVEQGEAGGVPFLMETQGLPQDDNPMLVIVMPREAGNTHTCLVYEKRRDTHLFESYRLNNPGIQRVINLVRDFSGTNIERNNEGINDTGRREKINTTRRLQTRQQSYSPVG